METTYALSEATIAVMGPTGTGKSSFVKLLTNDEKIRIGHGQESETDGIQLAHFLESGRCVKFVDTPGFDDSRDGVTDSIILKQIAGFLDTEFQEKRKLTGIIYMHRISDNKVGGVSRRNMRIFQDLCGADSLKNVFIVTTMWKFVPEEVGATREAELRDKIFKPFLDNGAHLVRHYDGESVNSARDIVVQILKSDPTTLLIQQELGAGKKVTETVAGSALNAEIKAQVDKQKETMEHMRQDMLVAIKEKDEEAQKKLQEDRKKVEEEATRLELERQKLQETLEADRLRAVALQKELEARYEKERRDLEERLQKEKREAELRAQQEARERLREQECEARLAREARERQLRELREQQRREREAAIEENKRIWEERQERQRLEAELERQAAEERAKQERLKAAERERRAAEERARRERQRLEAERERQAAEERARQERQAAEEQLAAQMQQQMNLNYRQPASYYRQAPVYVPQQQSTRYPQRRVQQDNCDYCGGSFPAPSLLGCQYCNFAVCRRCSPVWDDHICNPYY